MLNKQQKQSKEIKKETQEGATQPLAPKNGPKQKRIVLAIALVVIIIAAVAVWALRRPEETATTQEDAIDDFEFVYDDTQYEDANDGEVLGESDVALDDVPEVSEDDVPAAMDRDRERVDDITAINDALERFFNDKDGYPEKLEDLVPDYLDAVRQNPTPGGQDYSYTPIGSADDNGVYGYYDLGYTLEVGVDNISAGFHIANPGAIASF